ncbi:MAG: hypothetical protein ACLPKT_21665 [Methylocella sp.]
MFDYVLHAAEYVFTEAGRQTASAVCVSDVRLLVITQNPEFGPYLVRLIARHFEANDAAPDTASVSAISLYRKKCHWIY